MADGWYPGKHIWEGSKEWAKRHPSLAGAVIAGGTVVALVGTGPVGLVVGLSAAAAGSGIAKNIAGDAKVAEKEDEKK